MHRPLIDRYAAGADALVKGIHGLSKEELCSFPVPSTWSIQQIVLHLMDSDLIGADRMKRTIAEDRPLLIGYDESRFVERLHYEALDATLAAEVFRGNRRIMTEILRRATDAEFQREAIHNETGKLTLEKLLETYCGHVEHHMRFLIQKRELLGKPI